MPTLLAIPDAWLCGWSLEPLREELAARGHRLVAPDLPGAGDNAALTRTTLADWADQVVDAARAEAPPVIRCGHSRSGIAISEAVERVPESIAALVCITAFLVTDGGCLAGFARNRSAGFTAGMTPVADGDAVGIAAAIPAFYHCTPPGACARGRGAARAGTRAHPRDSAGADGRALRIDSVPSYRMHLRQEDSDQHATRDAPRGRRRQRDHARKRPFSFPVLPGRAGRQARPTRILT